MDATRLAAASALVLCCTVALAEEAPGAKPAPADPPAPVAEAARPEATPPRPGGRLLGGHRFMPAVGVTSAFPTTSFGTYLTAGYGATTGSVTLQVPGDPTPQTFDGTVEFGAIGGVMTYELAFHPNWSARVSLSEQLYSGTTGAAAAVVGTNARLGAGLGLTWGLPVGETVRVAAFADASFAPRIGLLLGPAVRDAYDRCTADPSSCSFDFDKLFEQENVFELRPGLAAAWAPAAALGLTANVAWVHLVQESSLSGTADAGFLSAGVAADLDLRSFGWAPVGLVLTWNSQFPMTGETDTWFTDVGGGLLYTGREDLSAGVQLLVRRFRVAPEVDVSWNTVVLLTGLRYYW